MTITDDEAAVDDVGSKVVDGTIGNGAKGIKVEGEDESVEAPVAMVDVSCGSLEMEAAEGMEPIPA